MAACSFVPAAAPAAGGGGERVILVYCSRPSGKTQDRFPWGETGKAMRIFSPSGVENGGAQDYDTGSGCNFSGSQVLLIAGFCLSK
jgi:hypothetical protein